MTESETTTVQQDANPPVVVPTPQSSSGTNEHVPHFEELKQIQKAKLFFWVGFVCPILWIVSIYFTHKTKSKQVYRCRRYSIVALFSLIAFLFCLCWFIIIIYALIPYPNPDTFDNVMWKPTGLYPGELIAIVWGFTMTVVLGFESLTALYRFIKKKLDERKQAKQ